MTADELKPATAFSGQFYGGTCPGCQQDTILHVQHGGKCAECGIKTLVAEQEAAATDGPCREVSDTGRTKRLR